MRHKYVKYVFVSVLYAALFGIITWELIALQDTCKAQSDGYQKWSCSRTYFEEFTNNFSAATAMEEAIKLKEDKVVSDCHLFAHFIGETTLEKHNFSPAEAFSSCILGCSNGCYHGVVEHYIRNEADPYNAVSKIQNMCDSVGSNDRRLMGICVHGVGHGLLAHGYLSPREAVDVCSVFSSYWSPFCVGGILMEHVDQYLLLDLDEDKFVEKIPEICAEFQFTEQNCLGGLSLGFLYYTGFDVGRSESLCEELQDEEQIKTCKIFLNEAIKIESPSILKNL